MWQPSPAEVLGSRKNRPLAACWLARLAGSVSSRVIRKTVSENKVRVIMKDTQHRPLAYTHNTYMNNTVIKEDTEH